MILPFCKFLLSFSSTKKQQQILVRMWRKKNPHTLLVGMQIGTTTRENKKIYHPRKKLQMNRTELFQRKKSKQLKST
jgi:hypothetical protein